MPIYSNQAIFLAYFVDTDPNKGEEDLTSENVASMLGIHSDLQLANISFDDQNSNNQINSNDDGQSTEPVSYDFGGAPTAAAIDSEWRADVTLTYSDDTTYDGNWYFVQLTDGSVFMLPDPQGSDPADTAALSAKPIKAVTLNAITDNSYAWTSADRDNPSMSIVCYAAGTLIETPEGTRPIETLGPGDRVSTVNHGPQTIQWVRRRTHYPEADDPRKLPILIRKGALCAGRPSRDLVVSAQHRILVGGAGQLQHLFPGECLVPAAALVKLPGIRAMRGVKMIEWLHFACDRHEVVLADGCQSESLLLGPTVLRGLGAVERLRLAALYPRWTGPVALNGPPARPCLRMGETRRLIAAGRLARTA